MRNIANYVIAIISLTLGFLFGQWILSSTDLAVLFPKIVAQRGFIRLIIYGSTSLLSALIFYILLSLLWKYGSKHVKSLADTIGDKPPLQIIGGSVGLLVGLIVAFFVSNIFSNVYSALNVLLSVITYTFFGTLGLIVGSRMAYSPEFPHFNIKSKIHEKNNLLAKAKVLDTSAIIDGRIVEIAKTGFIEGELVVPSFVLKELRHIADSADDLTRAKGRRGLDYINELKEMDYVSLTITDKDFKDVDEVDVKLLHLAMELKGAVITTDYNLNKVAILQRIPVLNVNDLSNAVKPNALPGESFLLEILKEGKEADQGVGYLHDGTMVVVDQGKNYLSQERLVEVTSSLQTPAGRMIFAKIKEE